MCVYLSLSIYIYIYICMHINTCYFNVEIANKHNVSPSPGSSRGLPHFKNTLTKHGGHGGNSIDLMCVCIYIYIYICVVITIVIVIVNV